MVRPLCIFLMGILLVCCNELLPIANTSNVSYSIIDSNHNFGVPGGVDSVSFLDGYQEDNGDIVFYGYTFKDGLFRTTISTNGGAQTDTANAQKTYTDKSVNFGPKFNDYKITLGNGLEDKLYLRNYGAPYAGGRLDVGPVADFDLEIRFYITGFNFPTNWHTFHTKTFLDSRGPLQCEYEYRNFNAGVSNVHAWDITNNQQLHGSNRDFLNCPFQVACFDVLNKELDITMGANQTFLPTRNFCVDDTKTTVVEYPCFSPTAQSVQDRSFLFISNRPYNGLPNEDIIAQGGLFKTLAYAFLPVINNEKDAFDIFYDELKREPRKYDKAYSIQIKRIPPGISSDLNQNSSAKNYSFDRTNKKLFTYASHSSGIVKLQGINEFDDQLKQKKTRFTFNTINPTISAIRACGLYETIDKGFVAASVVKGVNYNNVILKMLDDKLDSLYALQKPVSDFVGNEEDFTPRFYEDGSGLHFVLFDGLSNKLKLFNLSSSGAPKLKEWVLEVPSGSKITNLVKLDNNKLVAAFSSGDLALFDQSSSIFKKIGGRVKISGHENKIYYASVVNEVFLQLGSFDCSASTFDEVAEALNNFDTNILNHQIYATAEGTTVIFQIQPTAATTDMVYFKTDTQLKSIR